MAGPAPLAEVKVEYMGGPAPPAAPVARRLVFQAMGKMVPHVMVLHLSEAARHTIRCSLIAMSDVAIQDFMQDLQFADGEGLESIKMLLALTFGLGFGLG